jgi:hypothetical protein
LSTFKPSFPLADTTKLAKVLAEWPEQHPDRGHVITTS